MAKKKTRKAKSKSKVAKIIIGTFWAIFALGIFSLFFVFSLISEGAIGYMPPVEELENPKSKFASEIYTDDGLVMGRYYQSKANRIYVSYEEMSPYLVNALIATEDVRYNRHSGIDPIALARSGVKTVLLRQKSAGGGSTITQQLAKQLYSPSAGNLTERVLQKPIEWVIAVNLEKNYTKEEIINMYLNQFDFLYNAVGIQSAAYVYFGIKPHELKIEQAAMLIGMCKNPSYYNPVRREEITKTRRNVVLEQMYKYRDELKKYNPDARYLINSQAELDSLKKLPLEINFHKVDHKDGIAAYFREYLRMMMTAPEPRKSNYLDWQQQKYYEDSLAWATNDLYGWCAKNRRNIYTDGLKIYTTIDSRMQQYAEEAVKEHLGNTLQPAFFKEKKGRSYAPFARNIPQAQIDSIMVRSMRLSDRYRSMKNAGKSEDEIIKVFNTPMEMQVFSWDGIRDTVFSPMDSIRYYKYFIRSGFMSMDPENGYVKAYVGGPDLKYFQYDMASVGRRQVGSTIKPYLYALAMIEGYTPCDQVLNIAYKIPLPNGKVWEPKNGSKSRYGEMVTLKWALAASNNWISAFLIKNLSPHQFVEMLYAFGVKNKQIIPTYATALGSCEISVSEMVSAYTAFPSNGIRVEPFLVTRIEDNNGNIIAEFKPYKQEVFSPEVSYKMIDLMQAVVDGGTGSRVRFRYNIKAPMGGKTGTTQNHSDGWFMGYTPKLVSGVWVGGEDRSIHFDTMLHGQGASMALPIFGLFMQKVYADTTLGYSQQTKFNIPAGFNPCQGGGRVHYDSSYGRGGGEGDYYPEDSGSEFTGEGIDSFFD
ncbi:MAG: transglycosylase domain-containing protein [Candidatus Azobacteroides sp.]|nr:transglycosylase domain-containing protein [Candidatus Azobacteroides sp.]